VALAGRPARRRVLASWRGNRRVKASLGDATQNQSGMGNGGKKGGSRKKSDGQNQTRAHILMECARAPSAEDGKGVIFRKTRFTTW